MAGQRNRDFEAARPNMIVGVASVLGGFGLSKTCGTPRIVRALITKLAGTETSTINMPTNRHLTMRQRRPLSSKNTGLTDIDGATAFELKIPRQTDANCSIETQN
jgi:hypothetical protein